jgi:pimeloyl-ACP methyl ester carboxylesterase
VTVTPRKPLWPRIRRIWVRAGLIAFVGFFGWSFLAFRATREGNDALIGDDLVQVARRDGYWAFTGRPEAGRGAAGLLFFPGGLVEPAAYAPLTRAVARAGYPAVLIELPRRGAFGGADSAEVMARARAAMASVPDVSRWVIAGHSLGSAVAARLVREGATGVGGLVLIASSHPRESSLANLTIPVTKILGTRDCVADLEKSEETRHLLPAATRWIVIEGANHSQFAWYGFQPMDCFASISRDRQHQLQFETLVQALESASRAAR